jgi:hypothetical protein
MTPTLYSRSSVHSLWSSAKLFDALSVLILLNHIRVLLWSFKRGSPYRSFLGGNTDGGNAVLGLLVTLFSGAESDLSKKACHSVGSVVLVWRGIGGAPSNVAVDSCEDWDRIDESSRSKEKVEDSSDSVDAPMLVLEGEIGGVCCQLSAVSSVSSSESDSKRRSGDCMFIVLVALSLDGPLGQSLAVTRFSCPAQDLGAALGLKSGGGPLAKVLIGWKVLWMSFSLFVPQLPLSLWCHKFSGG